MIILLSALLVLGQSATFGNGYQFYEYTIPNGDRIPNPCGGYGEVWTAVGHDNENGGGMRNQFGEDYARLGRTWSVALCRLDSDRDGRTNGQELGDPRCVWKIGQVPDNSTGLSHPGICEPVDSARCVNALRGRPANKPNNNNGQLINICGQAVTTVPPVVSTRPTTAPRPVTPVTQRRIG